MEAMIEVMKNLKIEFAKEHQWNRYVKGDILYDVTDEISANTVHSYVIDPENDLSLEEIHRYFECLMQAIKNISIDGINKADEKWLKAAARNRDIFLDTEAKILDRWTKLVFKKCGAEGYKNEVTYQLESSVLSFWRASSERKGKNIFFPGIHIELVPFLQSIRVVQHFEQYTGLLQKVLEKYPLEFLYQYVELAEDPEPYTEQAPDIFVETKNALKKKPKKKSLKKGLTNTIELALKSGEKRKKKPTRVFQKTMSGRSPSLKRGEHICLNLYSEVKPMSKTPASKEKIMDGAEHKIDFSSEVFLGPIYQITSYESDKRPQKYGSWIMTRDADLNERKLNRESLLVSMKVPVDEVFLGSNEPVVAFREDSTSDWKKGVFTTHTQFDQNTFIVTTRLSKMGYISLFQHNDFHYPYKSWQISFEHDKITMRLHTNVVELAFVIEDHYFYLDTIAGDEFSKLKNLHQKKMSLTELMMKMEKHGVHIIPNEETINKHRDTNKELDLEIFTYRLICLNQIDCESCRMNSTVSMNTVIVIIDGAPRNITTKASGNYSVNFGDGDQKRNIHKSNVTPAALFQFLMVTRPLIVTK